MNFSQRFGFVSKKLFQRDFMDDDLRNGLWNAFYSCLVPQMYIRLKYTADNGYLEIYSNLFWMDMLKQPLNYRPTMAANCLEEIRKCYISYSWHEVYDFIEFNINKIAVLKVDDYIRECNRILEREVSGYRIIDKKVMPIIDSMEIDAINGALEGPFENVKLHLKTSLEKISDRKNPDYRNSIKESISAVENLCRELTGENTLGKALNSLSLSGIEIHSQFKDGFEKLYAYTNSKETGIRHSLMDSSNPPDFSEAKFMLIACSAFVNYIISKKSSG